ncbi:MAG TPA: TIGR03915 family putative DNA repair protein [Geobacteraceae bacterium]
MAVYLYDGTFDGLLTALATARESGDEPGGITATPPLQGGLFQDVRKVATDRERAAVFAGEIAARISPYALRTLYRAFLAEVPGGELLGYSYLTLGWRVGGRLGGMLAHERVAPVHRLALKVGREAHRMLGFVRFREVRDGFYYASIEPDHHVLPLIARHFADRFGDQHWVIHDLKRGKGIVHDAARREWVLTELKQCRAPQFTERELDFQRLWKSYFGHVAVEERRNLRLQQSKLPLKYRKYLTEL